MCECRGYEAVLECPDCTVWHAVGLLLLQSKKCFSRLPTFEKLATFCLRNDLIDLIHNHTFKVFKTLEGVESQIS